MNRKIDWPVVTWLLGVHLLGALGIAYAIWIKLDPRTIGLALSLLVISGLSITAGYHRLYSHQSYECRPLLDLVFVIGGTMAVQGSVLKWASDHRHHHDHTDDDGDPHRIDWGFFWAHMGWLFFRQPGLNLANVRDLYGRWLLGWQHRHYRWLAPLAALGLPTLVAALWSDWLGGLLVAGTLRLLVQYHSTWSINSFTHYVGKRPYDPTISARDSWLVSLITFGEGYHNYHHFWSKDYRNGPRWYNFDPTKWFVWSLSLVGLTRNLRSRPASEIRRVASRQEVLV